MLHLFFAIDKIKAIKGKWRIREIVLFHFPFLAYVKFAMTRVPKEKVKKDKNEKKKGK